MKKRKISLFSGGTLGSIIAGVIFLFNITSKKDYFCSSTLCSLGSSCQLLCPSAKEYLIYLALVYIIPGFLIGFMLTAIYNQIKKRKKKNG